MIAFFKHIFGLFKSILDWIIGLNIKDFITHFPEHIQYWKERTIKEYHIVKAKMADLSGTNYALACSHFKRHNWGDAKMRFKAVINMKKDHIASSHLYLARCYLRQNNAKKAATHVALAKKLDATLPALGYVEKTLSSQGPEALAEESIADQLLFWQEKGTLPSDINTWICRTLSPYLEGLPEAHWTDVSFLHHAPITALVKAKYPRHYSAYQGATLNDDNSAAIATNNIHALPATKEKTDILVLGEVLNLDKTPEALLKKTASLIKKNGFMVLYFQTTTEKNTIFSAVTESFFHPHDPINTLIENSLAMTKLESNNIHVKNRSCDFYVAVYQKK